MGVRVNGHHLAQLVDKVAFIREVNRIGIVDKTDKGGWFDCHLGGIKKLKPAPLVQRGLLPVDRILNDPVHHAGVHAVAVLLEHLFHFIKNLMTALAGLGRDGDGRGKR